MTDGVPTDLLKIDKNGLIHPIGVGATAQLLRSEGSYRLLPSPNHLILLQRLDEKAPGQTETREIRLGGAVAQQGAMCDVFSLICQGGWRGELLVYSDGRYRQLFFEGGNIVSASTNVEDERLGEVMYRFGAISREQLELILKASGGAGRFGSKAVELGVLSQEVVFSALRRQIEEIVFRSLAASSGTFYFLNDFDDSAIGMRVAISGTGLLMEALTRMDEVKYFEQKIPGAHCVPERTSKIGSDLSSDQKNLLSFIDGSQDIEQLGRSIGRGEFSTTKEIYALLQAGYLTIHNPNFASDEESVVSDASSVLQVVFRMAKERGILDGLMQSLNGFASSVGLYPILFGGDAGPDEQGAFNGETMLQNVRRLAPDEPMSALRQMLHDYLSFAVFSVGSSLGSEQEQELRQEIAEAFSRVAPGR